MNIIFKYSFFSFLNHYNSIVYQYEIKIKESKMNSKNLKDKRKRQK